MGACFDAFGAESSAKCTRVKVSLPWTPAEFVSEAVQTGHPFSLFDGVSSSLSSAIEGATSAPAENVAAKRVASFKREPNPWLVLSLI